MMDMAGTDERKLEKEQEIPTAIDPLRWDYYRYILAHLITRWDSPTAILYGGKTRFSLFIRYNRFQTDSALN